MSNKKITFILGGLAKGGAERVVNNLSNHLVLEGYDIDIITLLNDTVDYNFDSSINIINYSKLNKKYSNLLFYWFKNLHNYFKKNPERTIISFFVKINLITILSSIGCKNKLIVSERSDPFSDGRNPIYNILSKLLYKKCNYVVLQTKQIASNFYKVFGDRIKVIPNPIQFYEEYSNINPKENLIISVGNLKEAKNYSMFIDAINLSKNNLKDNKVIIYGEGELRKTLETKITEYHLEDIIHLPGRVDNIQKAIYKAKLFILPSNYEGMSNALQEALSLGLCCISTDCLGANELIKEDVSGIIIPRNNPIELSHQINTLIDDDKKRLLLGKNAYIYSKNFSIEKISNLWKEIL